VPRVVARLFDPRRVEIYQRLGLVTISSTTWGAERIRELLTHAELDTVRSFGGGEVTLIDVEVPVHLIGRTVRDLTVPGELTVVAITRDDQALLPLTGTSFRRGDVLHLAVLARAMNRVEELLDLGEGV
jgi:trk system potassium uptake protein TrkA